MVDFSEKVRAAVEKLRGKPSATTAVPYDLKEKVRKEIEKARRAAGRGDL